MYHHPQQFYGPNFPPPPPPPREARSPSYDPWKAHDAMIGNNRYDRSPSRTSQHTAVGSDFHPDEQPDLDATPKAKPPPSQSETPYGQSDSGRKRTYDRMAEIESEGRRRQADDTPRARRKPNYDRTDAYRYFFFLVFLFASFLSTTALRTALTKTSIADVGRSVEGDFRPRLSSLGLPCWCFLYFLFYAGGRAILSSLRCLNSL